ncbi:cell division protein FtsK [Allonocardiopsis opalescens]|uniref:S-DNA-T family DNA segregation ATPase FtsK/SpoIIIE n=1 Tax=Allonocardiopsis opalescens TaxID=1144618 RepID=A0A2T0Q747_9ACTN|nr:cell division protein FtsK [Allonocardiopsis opalescens]PRX99655.1 S-DNA-T family DNA segregation ATPase FtsK/SpoIIIE [Allonocardiopsis opalescens]
MIDGTDQRDARVVSLDRARDRDRRQHATPDAPDEPTGADQSDGDEATRLLVDQAEPERGDWLAELAERNRRRRPILPGWLKSRQEAAETAKWVAEYYAHIMAYQATRSPLYLLRLAARSPRGAALVIGGAHRWVFDAEGEPVRMAAVQRADAELYLKLSRQRDARVRLRVVVALVALVVLMLAGILVAAAPTWAQWAALALLVGVLGAAGAPADRPLIDRAVVPGRVARLDSDIVLRALGALGIAEINKARAKGADAVTFPAPITRDGPGWRAEVDLPYGVTVTDVIERRDRLASGLRRPLGCVWPEPVSDEHPGRLVLWVGDRDMSKAPHTAWPLMTSGRADLFKPLPFGTDQRGRPVSIPLMFANLLIGAIPRMGKTFALRVVMLAAALDVLAELRVFELKGTGDLSFAQKVAHDYASGADDDAIAACVASLREVYGELVTRAKTISGLPKDICPENKVTPELAAKRSLGLHPVVVAVDECQELFSHPVHGEEAAKLCEGLIKRGPALGIILVLATQRPDAKSLPTGISANVGIRFCLRVMGQVENDMVLGTSAYKNGVRATTFTAKDKGIGYLVGAADDPQIARSAYIDGPAADAIADRARALREAAGRLSGFAAGQTPDRAAGPAVTLLDDIAAVVPPDETDVWSETVVARLAELRPEAYRGWEPKQLAAALAPHGIDTVQIGRRVNGRFVNRRGINRDAITRALTERDHARPTG